MYSKFFLTVLLLFSLGMGGVALGQESESYAKVKETFAIKAVRLVMASAYQDPALVLQEVDSLNLDYERFEQVLAKDPERVRKLDEFRNITDMFGLYLLSEFGMVQGFK